MIWNELTLTVSHPSYLTDQSNRKTIILAFNYQQVQKGTSSTATNTHSVGVKFGLKTKGKASRSCHHEPLIPNRPHIYIPSPSLPPTIILVDFIFAQAEVELSMELRSVCVWG